MPGSDPRRTLGAEGERLARCHLEARGLIVLDANFRTRHGELDLVAVDERCLVFCEVKTRVAARRGAREPCAPASGSRGDEPGDDLGPFAAIGVRKRRQVRQMAREWLALRGGETAWREEVRFDAIGIEFDQRGRLIRLDHMEAAF
jgi:putative endonuclease